MENSKNLSKLSKVKVLGWTSFILVLFVGQTAQELHSEGVASQSCVSYQTNKEMFKFNSVSVVGKTCKVKIEKLPANQGKIPFRIEFSSKDLDSGSGLRDGDVADLLGDKVVYNLEIPTKLWEKRKTLDKFTIQGKLEIKTGIHPVAFSVTKQSKSDKYTGIYKGKYTDFGLEPPSVGPGGFISDVSDDLTLRFEIELK